MGRSDRQLGDKLGPRLAQLLVGHELAARKSLGPLEAKWQQAAMQAIVDQRGEETARLWRPITQATLAAKSGKLHPAIQQHLERTSSGRHQWESISGHAAYVATSSLSSVLSNVLAPVAYEINSLDRSTYMDAATAADAVAAGLISGGNGDRIAAAYGIVHGDWQVMATLAETVPDQATLLALRNRGELDEERLRYWLHRAGLTDELQPLIATLQRVLLTPADAALGWLRGDIPEATAKEIAVKNGLDPADFQYLYLNTGEPLGEQQLAEALRRGYIDKQRFAHGIRQSRIRDEWLDVALDLRYEPVPTADAIDAALRGWITDERARKIADQNGVLPDQVQILIDNAGNPPSNEQLLELRRRGFISDELLRKGIRQGRTRDEWIPQIEELAYEPLGLADSVDAWLRGHMDLEQVRKHMTDNGLLPADQQYALDNAGNPLALEQLLEAFRRGFIDRDRFVVGFRESRYRDEWVGTALELRHSPMSTADAVEASVQNWITKEQARKTAEENGLLPADFDPLWLTAGEPLSRTELNELYNRGLVGLPEFRQALRESRLKDRYIDQAIQLHVRQPQVFEIIRAITDGLITAKRGQELLEQQGYTAEVSAMLIGIGETTSTGGHKQLLAAQIQTLYSDRIISKECAWELLDQLHYTDASKTVLIELADFNRQHKILASGVAAIRSHYLTYRITDLEAQADLIALKLPPATVELYLQVWALDRLAHPKQLTEAQIVKAAKMNLLKPQDNLTADQWAAANQLEGCTRLVQLGYSPDDAQLLLAGA